jgi:DNA-binding SARP family transcriptional activator
MEFRILGPLEALDGGAPVAVPGIKERGVLAILLLHANELVSADRLIEQLWRDEPPASARKSLQVRVANLRKVLGHGGSQIVTQSPGYVLRVEPDQLDLHRFERLVAIADEAEPRLAADTLREALALWRGAPLADLGFEEFAQGPIARLEELRLVAVEKRVDAELELGLHADLSPELERLVSEHPLREGLRGRLMLALYRSGRQADALGVYRETRRVLDAELGLEPSPALQRLERAILAQDPVLEPEGVRPARPAAAAPTGTVTLLYTDIEESSTLVRSLGEQYGEVLSAHRSVIRNACHARNGYEVDAQGDALLFAFGRVPDAVDSAIAIQRSLSAHRWPTGIDVRVRIGVHTGTPSLSPEGYYGVDVVRGARVCAAGHGGQVLVSDATRALIPSDQLDRLGVRDLGDHVLKGIDRPERLFQIFVEGMREDFPPPRTTAAVVDVGGPVAPTSRSILVALRDPERVASLLAVAEPIALRSSRELILVHPVGERDELAEAAASVDVWRRDLVLRGLAARAAAFTSASVADDLVRAVAEQDVDLLLVEAPPELLDDEALAVTLARAACDVGVLVGGERVVDGEPILVPFGGAEHDWAAVELAARIAGGDRPLRLAGLSEDSSPDGRDASRLLASASLAVQRALGVSVEPVLVPPGAAALLLEADQAGLVVAGLSEHWRQRGLGSVRHALALGSRPPVLLVRRGLRPGVLAPPESLTRFTWTIRAG